MVRTGSIIAHGSGDYVIAFSTNRTGLENSGQIGKCLSDESLNAFFLASIEATEEAIYDAIFAAETMKGQGGKILEELPKGKVLELLNKYAYQAKK